MEFLFGSSLLPSLIIVGTKEVQLGEVVRRSVNDSGLSTQQWNDLEPLKREAYLAATVYKMREEAEKKS